MPVAKIVILNWNGEEHLRRFLPGVVAAAPEGVGVVVADNGSTDGSVALLAAEFPSVEVLALGRNYGFAEGYNRALARIEADYYILLNSDVETPQGWLGPLLETLDRDADVAAVAPKLRALTDCGRFEYAGAAGGFIDYLGYPFCRGRILRSTEVDEGQYDDARDVFWVSGAAFCCRAAVFRALGGFDPDFFAHMEEIDLCCRVHLAGLRVCALSGSHVYHVGGASLNQGNPKKTYLNFRNNLLLLHKNLPKGRGRRILFLRRLADTLAFGMFLLKGDIANARAVIKAHNDFRRMRGRYNLRPDQDVLRELPGANRNAVIARYLFRKKTLIP